MNHDELRLLMSPEALRLLDSLPSYRSKGDVLSLVSSLRTDGNSPEVVAAVLTQARLRRKAAEKFGEFASSMLFTQAGLEQATRFSVAARHAGRFSAAGVKRVADLGCGIGSDALALSALEHEVIAVERDEVTAAIAAFNLAPFPDAVVEHGDAENFDVSRVDGVYLDPARRTSGHANTARLTNPDDYSPSLDFAFGLAESMPVGIKLGPGFDRSLIPPTAEAQWISDNGSVIENGLWFGSLARAGITRSALVIRNGDAHEMTSSGDSADEAVAPLGEFLYEPDGAVIRARLIGDLARQLEANPVSEGIAYLSGAAAVSTPFARCFRIIEKVPTDAGKLKKIMREKKIGTLEIKKRGIDVDPALLRKKLSLKGDESATLILTRVGGKHTALLAERVD